MPWGDGIGKGDLGRLGGGQLLPQRFCIIAFIGRDDLEAFAGGGPVCPCGP